MWARSLYGDVWWWSRSVRESPLKPVRNQPPQTRPISGRRGLCYEEAILISTQDYLFGWKSIHWSGGVQVHGSPLGAENGSSGGVFDGDVLDTVCRVNIVYGRAEQNRGASYATCESRIGRPALRP